MLLTGTTAVSWMVHHHEGKKKVAATVLLDPVTFLLCDPTVATTFVYKDPTTTLGANNSRSSSLFLWIIHGLMIFIIL